MKNKDANVLKEFFKRWPGFYYFIYDYLSPIYFGGLSAKGFIKKYSCEGEVYNLGSGARTISDTVKNIDIHKYENVDTVGDITALPLKENSVDAIINEEVLEHVSEPKKAVEEIHRVLKKGGMAYITVPFMYPYHASPDDYTRWTHIGFERLLSDFEIIELGIRSGPFSTFTVYLCYFFATLLSFGNEKLYWTLTLGFTFLFFPIKFLDILGNKLPNAINMSSLIYCVVKKKDEDTQ